MMPRNRTHPRLSVYQNGKIMGYLSKQPSGAVEFIYADEWLSNERANPVSLSLPLREDAFKGAPVLAVFENLLPDSESLRSRVAEKIGADGTDEIILDRLKKRSGVIAEKNLKNFEKLKKSFEEPFPDEQAIRLDPKISYRARMI